MAQPISDKFQNKYRIASTRLQNWDYRGNAPYFVTICTKTRSIISGRSSITKCIYQNKGYWRMFFGMK